MNKILQITCCLLLIAGLQIKTNAQALDLDGTDDRFTVSDNNDFDYSGTNLTFEAWIKPTSGNSSPRAIIQKDRNANNGTGYMFYILDNQLGFALNNNVSNLNTVGNGTLTTNTWNHVALTYDGSTAIMYINGVLDKSTSLSFAGFVNSSEPVVIGEFTAASNYLEAEIDEIRMWNDVRTITEIQDNMHKQLTPASEANLIAYYQLDHADGTTSITDSKNSYTGTWDGFSGSNTTSNFTTSYAAFGNTTMNDKTDVRGLWQITGTNTTSESDGLTMQVGSALTETNFATFGHDNAGTGTTTNDMSTSTGINRYSQTWYVDETGTVSGATLTFDLGTISGSTVTAGTASDYVLLYRSGTSGDFTDVTTGNAIANTNQVSFTGVDLQDGYYTIGTPNSISGLASGCNALEFDGTDDYVNCSNNANFQITTGTIEGWLKTGDAGTGFRGIISKRQAYGLFLNDNVLVTYDWSNGTTTSTGVTLNDNNWHHIAMTFQSGVSNGTMIYIDGVLSNTFTYTISSQVEALVLADGGNILSGSADQIFTGELDEIRIWNDVRTASEIRTNKNHKLNGNEAGLVAYYSFDNVATANGTVGEIVDLTSNNHNGTTVNMTNSDIIPSTAAIIEGNTVEATNHQNQSQTVNDVTIDDTADPFDNSQDVSVTQANEEPNTTSGIAEANVEPKFYFINIFANGGAPGTFNVTATFFTSFPNGSVVVLYKRDDNSTGGWSIVGAATVIGGKVTYVGITSFSQFILASSTALPVELIDFNAQKIDKTVSLTWTTASELNNQGFEIERSQDGERWENIGFVEGNGTTTEFLNYEFIDENPSSSINYYRLKQIDFDEQFEYSPIVSITIDLPIAVGNKSRTIQIFPNPVQDKLNIISAEGMGTIYNMLGQPIKQFSINNKQFTINTTDLPKGQYILHITKQNGAVVTQQFLK